MTAATLEQAPAAQVVDYDPFADGELTRVAPTTEPQREVWLADRLGRDASLAFNESVSLQLRGPLDTRALQAALQQLLDRHDALRASIGPDGQTLCVRECIELPMPLFDLSRLAPAAREQALATHLRATVDTPFALDRDLLLRAELLRLAPGEHRLLLTAHHVVCDGWSWWVLVRELGALYAQETGHGPAALPPAESFADFALDEARHPHRAEFARDQAYWLSRFADGSPVLELPTDRPRPARRSFASDRIDHVLDAELVAAVRRMGARRGASLFGTLLAGFAGLLSRLAGQDDVVVGIPAAGQSVDGHDHLVGHCVNLLPLRFGLQPERPFAQAVDDAQQTLLDAIEHQRYTFGTLLKKLRIARDPARLPLVSVLFNIDQALDHESAGFPDLGLEFACNPRTHENFELFVNAVQVQGTLRLECQYNRDLFDADTVRRWLQAYGNLLRAAAAQPEAPLARLPLVDAQARAELAALQPAPVAYERERRMHEFFEAQCDRTPDRIALVFGDVSLSYAALDARANRIAHLLRTHGVHRGALVGLALDRGPDMVAGLLGVLKAGAGYVPLDPKFPADRLAYMAGDAGLATLVTQERHAGQFDLRGRPVLCLDRLDDELAAASPERAGRDGGAATPDCTAYVIYTSGSTGRPKGVQVPHRTVANFLSSMRREPGIDADDVLVAVTTLSFDIAVLELMLPLSAGARLVLADPATCADGAALAQLIDTSGATLVQATPATWRLLLDAGWGGRESLTMLCGGEPLPAELAARLLAGGGRLWNLYGPTETTVWSTCARIEPAPAGKLPDVHIGRPIANTRVWIVDAHGELCPRGVPGEVCIGGDGVTRGYLGRPELTGERFVPDRFSGDADGQARLYRTGDLGRWRPDGNLEHLGRLDHQVKVRGYRIELGEIETHLAAHPQVARAIAITREDRPGDVRLVAYVVPAAGAEFDATMLLDHLRGVLPDYMLPQHLVGLDGVPLLPNGKLDRSALPEPAAAAPATQRAAPRTPLEQTIATAMAHVLGLPAIGLDDDFFLHGGHSLLAAQLASRLNRELGMSLSLRALFDAPTVARLARIANDEAANGASPQVARRPDQSTAPLSLMQQRLWVLAQIEPGLVIYNTPSAHRLHGPLDEAAFERAFQELVRRQASLRTIIVRDGEGAVQQVLDTVPASTLPVEDLSAIPAAERQAVLQERLDALTAEPFHLDRAPLFRVRLFRLGEHDHVLFFMAHHIVWDGWSFDLFYAEMATLYAAYSEGRESPLPELEVSYGDFAAWHREWLSGDELAGQLEHWKQHLDGHHEPLQLPLDRPRPAHASGEGSTVWVHVDRELTEGLRELGNASNATLFMTLLAGYYVLLHRLSGQRDLIVGLPVRNRPSEALEPVMGFFVTMLPLRLALDPELPFRQLLAQVREAVVTAFSYPDVPFEQLVRELQVPRDQSRAPVYQTLFSFQDARQRVRHWGALEHEYVPVFQHGTAHDLGLWLMDSGRGLLGGLTFSTDILAEHSVEAMRDRFVALLDAARQAPDAPIGDLDSLSHDDRAALARWNATGQPLPQATTLHAMLQAQAERAPGRTAIRFDDTALSYAELDARASRIAAALRARGVQPGQRVGVCLQRTPDLVAAMVGVLKTGAAYVPLDPAYPRERLQFMADDAGLAQVVGQSALAGVFDWPRERLLLLDDDAAEIDAAPALPPSLVVADAAESAAYVIYTSGSTGKPKGVQVPHRAVVNFLASMAREPGIAVDDRWLAVTTTSFDIAVLELFGPLSTGAEIILASRETAMDGHALAALLERSGATVMQATPASWRMLLEAGWHARPGFKALCGGEALAPDLAARLLEAGTELWNMYGPTETTVWSTCCRIDSVGEALPIGRPIANTRVWVLDSRGRLCPPGVHGEICIGGEGVTLGYLGRPELTAERFVPDHVSAAVAGVSPGDAHPALMYRTGDLGRWRGDGQLEHLGRLDFQVKVRGYRIELGEIESRLLDDPTIARATVLAREDRPGDVRLVAYVVARAGASVEAAPTFARLRQALPDYMVPQHLLLLDEMPLLPNGKVDRKALPAPVARPAQEPAAQVQAADEPLVGYVARVWSELFDVPVAADDDFFELGGHSLLAVQLFHRLNQGTGVNLPLASLFGASTVRALARAYRDAGATEPAGEGSADPAIPTAPVAGKTGKSDPWAPLVHIREGDGQPPLFLIHAVGGNVLNYRRLAASMPPGPPIYGLQALGLDGRTAPLTRVEDMAERYVREIRAVQPHGPYHLAGGSMGGIIAFEMAQQLSAAGEEIGLLALIDTAVGSTRYPALQQPDGRLARALRRFGNHFEDLPMRRWPATLWAKITGRLNAALHRGRVAWARRRDQALPHSLRYAEVEATHQRAYRDYRVRPYPGAIVLFRAEDQRQACGGHPTLGWDELVGAVEVVPVSGDHQAVVEAPELPEELHRVYRAAREADTPPAAVPDARVEAAGAL